MEDKTARFTILIDAEKKRAFEQLCAAQDVTASQMIRRLIRAHLEKHGVDPAQHAQAPARAHRQRRK